MFHLEVAIQLIAKSFSSTFLLTALTPVLSFYKTEIIITMFGVTGVAGMKQTHVQLELHLPDKSPGKVGSHPSSQASSSSNRLWNVRCTRFLGKGLQRNCGLFCTRDHPHCQPMRRCGSMMSSNSGGRRFMCKSKAAQC